MLLARCSFATACEILGQNSLWFDKSQFDNFMSDPTAFFNNDSTKKKEFKIDFPFKEYSVDIPIRFTDYLVGRGFFYKHIPRLFAEYSLKYCTKDRYYDRIIIPVFMRGEQITFTSRSIGDEFRYLSLSEADGALDSIKNTLYNFDNTEGSVLFVGEGPLDVLKVDFYGKKMNCRATCIYGKNIKSNQALLLDEMSERFDKIVFLLDATEFDSVLSIEKATSFIKKETIVGTLPKGVSDPGELSIIQVKDLCKKYL